MPAKPDKAAVKEAAKQASKERSSQRRERWSQFWQAFNMQRKEDKLLLPILIGCVLAPVVVAVVVSLIVGLALWALIPLGVVLGVLFAVIVFGRRVQKNVYSKAEGQPGAAAWALDNLRGKWKVAPTVAGTTQLDAVHRVIGRPGVILVAEGAPHRAKGLLAQEKKRVSRVVGSVPIYDVLVGNEAGQIPLRRLQQHIMKLPRNISTAEVDSLETKMAALASRGAGAALPKGPLPQGAKMRNVQRTMRRR